MSLTARQHQILEFIREFIDDAGYPPTVREIGKAMGIASPNGVMRNLHALEKKGAIARLSWKARCIRIVEDKAEDDVDALLERIDVLMTENQRLRTLLSVGGVDGS